MKKGALLLFLVLCFLLWLSTALAVGDNIGENGTQVFANVDGDTLVITGDKGAKLDREKLYKFAMKHFNSSYFVEPIPYLIGGDVFHVRFDDPVSLPDNASMLFENFQGNITFHPDMDTSNITDMSRMFA